MAEYEYTKLCLYLEVVILKKRVELIAHVLWFQTSEFK